jgi:hypothetical protein
MLSLDEIRNLADAVTTRSTLKLLKFRCTRSKRAGQTVTQIVFVERGNEYRVWIVRDILGIYLAKANNLGQRYLMVNAPARKRRSFAAHVI